MKNIIFPKVAPLAALMAALLFSACEPGFITGNKKVIPNTKEFDIEQFTDNVEAGLGQQWAGYSYVISQDGQMKKSGTFGERVSGTDGSVSHDINAPIYLASLNKVITAAAMLRVLEENSNGNGAAFMLNANVYNFLPTNWTFGPNSTSITFRDLLQHRTGIPSNAGIDYADLRTLFAGGISANDSYQYSNANYALLRVLIAMMTGSVDEKKFADNQYMSSATLAGFRRYVENNFFNPLSIKANTRPFGSAPALGYRFQNLPNDTGWNLGDLTNRLGNGGWYMSARDYAKFMAYLNHTESLLSADARKAMYDNYLGWSDEAWPVGVATGDHGAYFYKGGSMCSQINGGTCVGKGVRNIVAYFPKNGVEVVILTNSRGGNMDTNSGMRNMLRDAYDNAWVIP